MTTVTAGQQPGSPMAASSSEARPLASVRPAPDVTPRRGARIAGVGYVLIYLLAIFANFAVLDGLVVDGDAAGTTVNVVGARWACSVLPGGLPRDLLARRGGGVGAAHGLPWGPPRPVVGDRLVAADLHGFPRRGAGVPVPGLLVGGESGVRTRTGYGADRGAGAAGRSRRSGRDVARRAHGRFRAAPRAARRAGAALAARAPGGMGALLVVAGLRLRGRHRGARRSCRTTPPWRTSCSRWSPCHQ